MTCPNCGTEMEKGRLFGKTPLIWSPKKRKLLLVRGTDEVHVIDDSFPEAHICKTCRKIIIDY